MTKTEAARRLGVHPNTIRNWLRSGVLPSMDLDAIRDARSEMLGLCPPVRCGLMLMGFRAAGDGSCGFCGDAFAAGDQIVTPVDGSWGHADCASAVGWDVYRRPGTHILHTDALVVLCRE